jgi:hypothetical protein
VFFFFLVQHAAAEYGNYLIAVFMRRGKYNKQNSYGVLVVKWHLMHAVYFLTA